jgi:tetratricopeptide (TPR) repeat protein
MSSSFRRAIQLRDHRRYDDAIAALHQHLAADPDDADGHLELAITRLMKGGEGNQALDDVDRAIALAPEWATCHAIRSSILHDLSRYQDALTAADRARVLDPESPFAWFCRGNALIALRLFKGAEDAARKALELDPDDTRSSNLLAMILRMQRRFDEAEVHIDRHLAKAPEDPWTFATAGWTALHQGQRKKAEELFREALRLDPDFEHARLGLREAYKARSGFYRLYLKWCFFMQRHQAGHQWLFIIGLFVAYRFGVAILQSLHPLAAIPLIAGYLLFVFGSFLANGLGCFLILKDRLARLSLTRFEKIEGLTVGGLFFSGLIVLVLGVTVLPTSIAFVGAALMGAAVPASMIFRPATLLGIWVFGGISFVAIACAVAAQFQLAPSGGEFLFTEMGSNLLDMALVAVVGSTWLSMVPALRKNEE